MSLENPIPHLYIWFAHPFRPLLSLVVMLTPPLLGWLCPKGQVTRAQEAEENYLVKRELATIKQQSEEASAQLEQAKKTIRQLQQQQQQQPHAVRRATESPAGRLHWLRSCRAGARWHGDWDDSQVSLCCAVLKPHADHFKIMWCATNDSSKNEFHCNSNVSRLFRPPLPSWHVLPSNKIQAVAEQGFPPFAHWLWVIICFGMHEFKLGHRVQRSSATIYSLVHPQKCIHEFVSIYLTGWQTSHMAPCSQKPLAA